MEKSKDTNIQKGEHLLSSYRSDLSDILRARERSTTGDWIYTYGPDAWVAAKKFLDDREKKVNYEIKKLSILYGP